MQTHLSFGLRHHRQQHLHSSSSGYRARRSVGHRERTCTRYQTGLQVLKAELRLYYPPNSMTSSRGTKVAWIWLTQTLAFWQIGEPRLSMSKGVEGRLRSPAVLQATEVPQSQNLKLERSPVPAMLAMATRVAEISLLKTCI